MSEDQQQLPPTQHHQEEHHVQQEPRHESPVQPVGKRPSHQEEQPPVASPMREPRNPHPQQQEHNGNLRVSVSQSSARNSQNGSATRKSKLPQVPGIVMDEWTEYAMAKEGVDIEDLMPKPLEDFLRECNGNHKLAQMRYDYKEAERHSLIQDIENRKKIIQLEIANDNQYNTLSPDRSMAGATGMNFYATQQPGMMSKMSRMSASQAQMSTMPLQSMKAKKQVDNKIFENMLRNQVEQELKLRQIQERQELFLMKNNQMQEKRQREIMKKQEVMQLKQQLKEEKLKKQEEMQKQWQQETLQKLKMKSELTEQRQQKYKHELQKKLHEKEAKKELKRHHADQVYTQQMEQLQEYQKHVEAKTHVFQQKLEVRAKVQKDVIKFKKEKKEQVLNNVQDMRETEEQMKMERFRQAQFMEMEKERRIEEDRKRQQLLRMRMGQQKSEKIMYKVEEAYKKMEDWKVELEHREKAAEDNLKKQQKILQEKQQIKVEMKRLKQESAQLKQKRKEAKEKLKKEEQLQKIGGMFQKMEKFKEEQTMMKMKKQQEIFKAEQKRADMKTAFYHMAVWNVQEAGDLIKEILDENDKATGHGVKPKSVAEKVREKAAKLRRNERMGFSSPKGFENGLNFISEEGEEQQEVQFERAQEQPVNGHASLETQKVVYDRRQHE